MVLLAPRWLTTPFSRDARSTKERWPVHRGGSGPPPPHPHLAMPSMRSILSSLAAAIPATFLACDAPAPPRAPDVAKVEPAASASVVASASASGSAIAAPPPAPSYPQPPPPDPPIKLATGGKNAVKGEGGLVTSVEHNASRIGADVLRRGGNAVDAAVAMGFALAVTHPSAGNLGGGGFMIVRRANGDVVAIDFREAAPAAATAEKNKAQLDAGAFGYLSAPVPGTVAGLTLALERFGSRPLRELVAPSIELAKKGHKLGMRQALVLGWSWERIKHDAAMRAVWGNGKAPHKEGDRIKQPDLARTLEAIAKEGKRGFYEGRVAAAIDKAMRDKGGLVTLADLKSYEAKVRTPLRFSYRGFTIDTMPPPSMGGVAFAQIMLTLERRRAYEEKAGSAAAIHLFVEAARRAYAERRIGGADPDFMKAGQSDGIIAKLLSGEHIETRKPAIDRDKATPSSAITADASGPAESKDTTHFSVVDAEGNAVACTYTLSAPFGAKVMVPGTGVIVSNSMGAFSPAGANALAPGKRMASSMTPAIVAQNGKLAAVLGSPGGDTIPNTVAQILRNLVDWHMTIDEAVAAPRVHHQYFPDRIRAEKIIPFPREVIDDLKKRGHVVDLDAMPIGHANDIVFDAATGVSYGVADVREGGKAIGVDKTK